MEQFRPNFLGRLLFKLYLPPFWTGIYIPFESTPFHKIDVQESKHKQKVNRNVSKAPMKN